MHNHPEDNTFDHLMEALRKNGTQNKDIEQKSLIFVFQKDVPLHYYKLVCFQQHYNLLIHLTKRRSREYD
jgi:hypothetical protein